MIYVPPIFKPVINTVYPPNNIIEFERWLGENFKECVTDREYLDIYWTGYYVNNEYGNNHEALQRLTVFLNDLPREKKYWTCVQYDDGILNNIDHLDLLQFNMSKKVGIEIPLICEPYSTRFNCIEKKYIGSFIGKITHPIRQIIVDSLKGEDGFYISTETHDYEVYNKIISESLFCLSPRGYGLASFRCYSESVYQDAIPVYISDYHVIPFGIDFSKIGVLIGEQQVYNIYDVISSLHPIEVIKKQNNLRKFYDEYFSYIGCMKNIILHLESEYNGRINN